MKPISIAIQAFGPFADRQVVNFTALGENPLFLINGPTGAGKSTLLDAICFALYGESTGKEREPAAMRCDLAPLDLPTEVTFDFILSEHAYRVIRTPAQELTKKKGTGTTVKGPTALVYRYKNASSFESVSFSESDQNVELLPLKGVKEVNEWVSDLTGLSSEQFRQVMVLPQGQFRKLLLADSDQRETIFSQLFQTHIFKQIEERLKLKSADLRNNRKALNDKVFGLLDSVNLDDSSALNEQLLAVEPEFKQAKSNLASTQNKLKKAEQEFQVAQEIEKKIQKKASLAATLQTLEKDQVTIDTQIKSLELVERANKIKPMQVQMQHSVVRLKQETAQQENIQQKVEKLKAQRENNLEQLKALEPLWKSIDDKKHNLKEWQRKKQLLAGLIENKTQLKQLEEKSANFEQSMFSVQAKLTQTEASIKANATALNDNTKKLFEKPALEVEFNRFEYLGRIKAKVEEAAQNIVSLDETISKSKESFALKDQQQKQLLIALQQAELSWHQGQAAELARQLNMGEPCMVCGSLEHPNPANQGADDYASKEQVDSARSVLNSSQKQVSDLQAQITTLEFQRGELINRINELNQELGEQSGESIEWFRAQWQRCKAALKELEQLEKNQIELEKQQQALSQKVEQFSQQITELTATRDQNKVECSTLAARIQEKESEIPAEYRQAKAVDQKIDHLQEEIDSIAQQHQQATEQQQEIAQQLSAQQSLLSDITNRLSELTKLAEKERLAWQQAIQSSGFASEAQFEEFCWSEQKIQQQQNIVDQHKAKVADTKAQLSYIETELKESPEANVEQFKHQVDEQKQAYDKASELYNQLANQYESLKRVADKLKAIQSEVDAIEAQYKVVGTLADVASGQTGNRVSLQRYVLGVLLDDVLAEASQRLLLMSKGRYRLTRKLDRSKGNKTSGLELEIEDAYSGARRPANTLSGGESFMAALSLALGLSDVVQSYSGGIKLETLFIDEGFGSLDMESLDLAIQTLVDLRKSGRTIGIISHVSELKEQMSQRIDVTPSDQGSTVSIVAA
ncbi:SMC family ATPase [Reinekea marina]|uniref:SMC family ATPase n=1 Tax=Reinekea marina TaxID=1310421 RepID=A0ABV7WS40_9GAMM|nr:SMC family ATPase [Reinekea marina]MDN3649133.1 SMC family ATPase [Reinekea marina]